MNARESVNWCELYAPYLRRKPLEDLRSTTMVLQFILLFTFLSLHKLALIEDKLRER